MQTHPLLGTRIASPIAASLYEATVGTGVMPFLADHVVFGDVVAPGAMHAVLGLCMAEMRGSPAPAVADLVFAAALTVPDGGVTMQCVLQPDGGFTVYGAAPDGGWTEHASGRIEAESGPTRTEERRGGKEWVKTGGSRRGRE